MPKLSALTPYTDPSDDDYLVILDESTSTEKRIKKSDLLKAVGSTTITTLIVSGSISIPDGSVDTSALADGAVTSSKLSSSVIEGAQQGSTPQTLSQTEADITGTSATFTLAADSTVLFIYTSVLSQNNNARFTNAFINIDGTNDTDSQLTMSAGTTGTTLAVNCTTMTKKNLGSGSHTVKLRGSLSGGGGAAQYSSWYGIVVSQTA